MEITFFDGGPAGGFVPNMSKEDVKKFRAQHIKGDNERIEIKVQMNGVNMVIVVFKQIYDVKYSSVGITEWRNVTVTFRSQSMEN